MADLICPYCWERTQEKQLLRQCGERCAVGENGQDEFYPAVTKTCPHGKPASGNRYCPNCHSMVQYEYITTKGRIVAMIGSRESGKTTYVGVLIQELQNRVGSAFNGATAELVGDKSRERYKRVFHDPMYLKGQTVDFTNTVRAQSRLDPLLCMLKFPKKKLIGGGLATAMMVFYDTAGEDVLVDENIDRLVDYFDAAEAIIFIVDPLQISSVRRVVNGSVPLPHSAADQVEIVQRLAELLRKRRKMTGSQKISTPMAIAIAKTDTLDESLPVNSAVRRQGVHDGVYDEADGQYIHDEIRATLSSWADGEALINTVANNFATYRFFGMSALGVTPPDSQHVSSSGIHPLRVEDPLEAPQRHDARACLA